jgi:hypothetical protein
MNIGITYQERGTEQGYEAAEAEYRGALPPASASGEAELLGDVLFNLAQLLFYLMACPRDALGHKDRGDGQQRAGLCVFERKSKCQPALEEPGWRPGGCDAQATTKLTSSDEANQLG